MAIVPCPHTWVLPFPRGQFPVLDEIHHRAQATFFALLLPGMIVQQVKPVYRKEVPRCSWEVICKFDGQIQGGLSDHIHQVVEHNKCMNTVVEEINFYDEQHFSVMYNIMCQCNSADF